MGLQSPVSGMYPFDQSCVNRRKTFELDRRITALPHLRCDGWKFISWAQDMLDICFIDHRIFIDGERLALTLKFSDVCIQPDNVGTQPVYRN
jgi:hypothetical protein